MSHGPSSEGSVAEPNLTPLLDVVLQLLMFFMMCVNFVNDQVKEDVKLPETQSAVPMDKTDTDVLFLNIKPFNSAELAERGTLPATLAALQEKFREKDPCILVVGKDPMRPLEFRYWLK